MLNVKRLNIAKAYIFLIGFFSTFQILEIAGVNVFSILVWLYVSVKIIKDCKKYYKLDKWILAFFISIIISEIMIFTIPLNNKIEWEISSIKKLFILLGIFLFYICLRKDKTNKINVFFKGVYISCWLQVIWCYMQFAILKVLGININSVLFNSSQFNLQGEHVLTGLTVNAGILGVSILFVCVFAKSILVKIMAVAICFVAGSSTLIICGILIILGECYLFFKNYIKKQKIKISKKKILFFIAAGILLLIILCFNNSLYTRISNIFNGLIKRLGNVHNQEFVDGSTYTHSRYYTSVMHVLKNLKWYNVLWGFGLGCAGVPFVYIFEQYPDEIYVPESDYITFLYNFGIVGLFIILSLFIRIIYKGSKISNRYSLFMVILMILGIFYGMQLNWVLLVEFLLLDYIKKDINLLDVLHSKN